MDKLRYTVVLEWDPEERLFVAAVPALTVSTYGETREETLDKVKEAITVTVEGLRAAGQPVPHSDEGKVEVVEVTM